MLCWVSRLIPSLNLLDNKEIEYTFLLNEKKSIIGHINGLFRLVLASPDTQ